MFCRFYELQIIFSVRYVVFSMLEKKPQKFLKFLILLLVHHLTFSPTNF